MCGIAGVHVLTPTKNGLSYLHALSMNLLHEIDSRGGDATGFAYSMADGHTVVQKASTRAPAFARSCRTIPHNARTILLHTRFATQGDHSFPENNHPIVAGPIAAVHNGVIQNDHSLFRTIEAWTRVGQVDSEVIPALVLDRGWDKALAAIAELDGSYAVAMTNAERPGEVIVARGNDSPVHYYENGKVLVWASTELALKNAWANVFGTKPTKIKALPEGMAIIARGGKLGWEKFTPIEPYYYSRSWTQSDHKTGRNTYYRNSSDAWTGFDTDTGTGGIASQSKSAAKALPASTGTTRPPEPSEVEEFVECAVCFEQYSLMATYDFFDNVICADCAEVTTGMKEPEEIERVLRDWEAESIQNIARKGLRNSGRTHEVPMSGVEEASAREAALAEVNRTS